MALAMTREKQKRRMYMKFEEMSALELAAALECCARTAEAGGVCENCPREVPGDEKLMECCEAVKLAAARVMRELWDGSEKVTKWLIGELVRLAGEVNTAMDRGLAGVADELFSQMQAHQATLVSLCRSAAIQAEPQGEKGWRVLQVAVEGRVVFGGDGGEGQSG